jgi:hypothetical protein
MSQMLLRILITLFELSPPRCHVALGCIVIYHLLHYERVTFFSEICIITNCKLSPNVSDNGV